MRGASPTRRGTSGRTRRTPKSASTSASQGTTGPPRTRPATPARRSSRCIDAVASLARMRSLVVVPTYQEAGNVERFLEAVRAAAPDFDILVVDDNSPDDTGELAEKKAADLGRVHVIHRPRKGGLGNAYRHGFRWGLNEAYDVIVQMDCDFSHDPGVLPRLIGGLDDPAVDCMIG